MKYVLFFCNGSDDPMAEADTGKLYAAVGEWWGQHSAAGRLVGGEQLQPATTATTVRFETHQTFVTDGPFIEAKETVGGYALIDVANLDEALELAKTWPARGTVEIRPVVESQDDHE